MLVKTQKGYVLFCSVCKLIKCRTDMEEVNNKLPVHDGAGQMIKRLADNNPSGRQLTPLKHEIYHS